MLAHIQARKKMGQHFKATAKYGIGSTASKGAGHLTNFAKERMGKPTETISTVPTFTNTFISGYRMGTDVITPVKAFLGKDEYINKYDSLLDKKSKDILYDHDNLESSGARRVIMDEYFNRIGMHQQVLSLQVLSSLAKIDEEMFENNKESIEEAMKIGGARAVKKELEKIYAGERDPKRKQLLLVLQKIEQKNIEMIEKYEKLASEQNPVNRHIIKKKKEYGKHFHMGNINGSFFKDKLEVSYSEFKSNFERGKNAEQDAIEDINQYTDYVEKRYTDDDDIIKDLAVFKNYVVQAQELKEKGEDSVENLAELYSGVVMQNEERSEKDKYRFISAHYIDPETFQPKVPIEDIDTQIKAINQRSELEKLEISHNDSEILARDVLTRAFHNAGGMKLSDQLPTKTDRTKDNYLKDVAVKVNTFARFVGKAVEDIDPKSLAALNISEKELVELTRKEYNKLFATEYMEALDTVDSKYKKKMWKDKPADEVQDEIFQKMLLDNVYNELMKKNGGWELFAKTGSLEGVPSSLTDKELEEEKKKDRNNLVDVKKNVEDGTYSALYDENNKEFSRMESDAIDLYNIGRVFDKMQDGSLSKSEAQKFIKDSGNFLTRNEKDLLMNDIKDVFKQNKLTEEALGKITGDKSPEAVTQDYISGYYARKYFMESYETPGSVTGMFANIGLHSKTKATLFSCLARAENPAVTSQTSSSETRSCMKSLEQDLDQKNNGITQALESGLAAMFGGAFFAVLAKAYINGKRQELYSVTIESALAEAEGIGFVKNTADPIEKLFREKAILTDKNGVSDGIIGKDMLDDYVFQSIKAQHDFHLHENVDLVPMYTKKVEIPQSDGKFKTKNIDLGVEGIRNSKDKEDSAISTRFTIRDILKNNGVKELLESYSTEQNRLLKSRYTLSLSSLEKGGNYTSNIGKRLKEKGYIFSKKEDNLTSEEMAHNKDIMNESVLEENHSIVEDIFSKEIIFSLNGENNSLISVTMSAEDKAIMDKLFKDSIAYEADGITVDMDKTYNNMEDRIKTISYEHESFDPNDPVDSYFANEEKDHMDKKKGFIFAIQKARNIEREQSGKIDITRYAELSDEQRAVEDAARATELLSDKMKFVEEAFVAGGIGPSVIHKTMKEIDQTILGLVDSDGAMKIVANVLKPLQTELEGSTKRIARIDAEIASIGTSPEGADLIKNLQIEKRRITKVREETESRMEHIKTIAEDMLGVENNAASLHIKLKNMQASFFENFPDDNKDFLNRTEEEKILKSDSPEVQKRKTEAYQERLLEAADKMFSQGTAFGSDFEAQRAFTTRYGGGMAKIALIQDLKLLDEFNAMVHDPDANNGEAIVGRKSKSVSESVAAAKATLLELYITNEKLDNGTLTTDDILRDLYETQREGFIDTASVDFAFVDQEDGKDVQVFTVDKSENPENIKGIISALGVMGEKDNENINVRVKARAKQFMQKFTGIGVGNDASKKNSRRSGGAVQAFHSFTLKLGLKTKDDEFKVFDFDTEIKKNDQDKDTEENVSGPKPEETISQKESSTSSKVDQEASAEIPNFGEEIETPEPIQSILDTEESSEPEVPELEKSEKEDIIDSTIEKDKQDEQDEGPSRKM